MILPEMIEDQLWAFFGLKQNQLPANVADGMFGVVKKSNFQIMQTGKEYFN